MPELAAQWLAYGGGEQEYRAVVFVQREPSRDCRRRVWSRGYDSCATLGVNGHDRSGNQPSSSDAPAGHSGAVILVVDDDPDLLTILRVFFSVHGGYEVVTASSATEALQRVGERLPDLIVTDYSMPAGSGLALCRALRTRAETRHIPIILHSAVDLPDGLPCSYDRAIKKPAELDAMLEEVRALLARARSRGRDPGRQQSRGPPRS